MRDEAEGEMVCVMWSTYHSLLRLLVFKGV